MAKPVSQIFGLVLEDINGYIKGKHHFDKIKEKKKRDQKKAEYASKLLFERPIITYDNKRTGVREITEFFQVKKKVVEIEEVKDSDSDSDSGSGSNAGSDTDAGSGSD